MPELHRRSARDALQNVVQGGAICGVGLLLVLAGRTVAPARAQEPPLVAWMFASSLRWTAPRGTVVRAYIYEDGRLKAAGGDIAGTRGDTAIRLDAVEASLNPSVLPGDVIVVRVEPSARITITVPTLVVDVDAIADRVVGRAPPGATVRVELAGGVDLGTRTADPAGAFEVDRRCSPRP